MTAEYAAANINIIISMADVSSALDGNKFCRLNCLLCWARFIIFCLPHLQTKLMSKFLLQMMADVQSNWCSFHDTINVSTSDNSGTVLPCHFMMFTSWDWEDFQSKQPQTLAPFPFAAQFQSFAWAGSDCPPPGPRWHLREVYQMGELSYHHHCVVQYYLFSEEECHLSLQDSHWILKVPLD